MGLEVTTALHCTKKQLQSLSGLTFLVDENWSPSNENFTLPIAFFHMLSCKEFMQSDVSEKRIILYQSDATQAEVSGQPVKQSVLEVIADNRLNRPKTYTCEVLIPYGDLSTMFNHSFSAMNNALTFLETNTDAPTKQIQSTIQALYASLKTFSSFASLMLAFFPKENLQNLLGIAGSASFGFNSKSLEKMREESAFCLFKSWDSWDTKRVSIKNLTFDKKGTEDRFIRGTIELVETPIYTIGAKGSGSIKKMREPTKLEKALKTGISGFIEFYKEP